MFSLRRFGQLAAVVAATLVAATCDDDPTGPRTTASHTYGIVEVTISGVGTRTASASAQFTTVAPTGPGTIQMEVLSSGSFTDGERGAGGQRYLFATFRVRNASQAGVPYQEPRRNLTFVAVDTDATHGITALSRLGEFAGGEITGPRAEALANSFVPTGQVHRDVTGKVVSTGPDVLQVFLEEEVAAIDRTGTRVTDIFPFGFSTRCVANCIEGSRVLVADPAPDQWDGRVTFAFRVPLQASAADEPFTVVTQFLVVDDVVTRVTRSPEEAKFGGSEAFESHALKVGAEVVTLLDDMELESALPVRTICDARVAGSVDDPITTLGDASSCSAGVVGPIFVDASAMGRADGTTWRDAFPDLRQALAAAVSGDEIWVAAGVYRPSSSDRAVSFEIRDGVELYGGFAGSEVSLKQRDWAANPTVLSGDLHGNDGPSFANMEENSYHVLRMLGPSTAPITAATVLDGFVVEGGNADGPNDEQKRGGGLYCDGSSAGLCAPMIRNTVFRSNRAAAAGGGFTCKGSNSGACSATLTDVLFQDNWAELGGGLYIDGRENGQAVPILRDVAFAGGRATDGGAFYADARSGGYANPFLAGGAFVGNSATRGGATFVNALQGGHAAPLFVNALWFDNDASEGGAIYDDARQGGDLDLRLVNVVFARNQAERGAAMLSNGAEGGRDSVRVSNSIFWGNVVGADAHVINHFATLVIDHSLIEGGLGSIGHGGSGSTIDAGSNIQDDPLFDDPDGGNLRLRMGSPAIDHGDNGALPAGITVDLDRAPRIVGAAVDLGPHEFQ